jgi:undecaprenyl-diphosphatase
VGTLIPVCIVLFKEIIALFKRPFNKFLYLIIATIPAGIIGIAIESFVSLDEIFSANIWLLSITFSLTAFELIFAERYCKKQQMLNPINCKTSLIMGAGQAIGVFPGLSRSGTTVTFGTIAKVNREDNANFSFLMSIPVILASMVFELFKISGSSLSIGIVPLIVGFLFAFLFGWLAIKFMLKVVAKAHFYWFSVYLVILSLILLFVNI